MLRNWHDDDHTDFLSDLREKADLALHPNAGAPFSEPFSDQKNGKMEESEMEKKQKLERENLCPIDSQVTAILTD